VHILDTIAAVQRVLAAPIESVSGQILNVGSNAQNYQVREIAEIVSSVVPGCVTSFGPPSADNRSYRVSFDKIARVLPGFSCAWDARAGAEELAGVFRSVDLDAALFAYRGFTRLDQLQYLIRTGQLDAELRWTPRGAEAGTAVGRAT
jgi:hypothetical protein